MELRWLCLFVAQIIKPQAVSNTRKGKERKGKEGLLKYGSSRSSAGALIGETD